MDELRGLLVSEVRAMNLEACVNDEKISQLLALTELLMKWNRVYNLTSIKKGPDIILKHIADSISVAPFITGQNYADAGSGPGFPGIPLAILFPEKNFYLLESLGKKINFQREVKRQLRLENIFPEQTRCELFTPPVTIDGVISRAFASLPDMRELCKNIPAENGEFLALKGEVPENELKELSKEFEVLDIIRIQVNKTLGQRHLIRLIKRK